MSVTFMAQDAPDALCINMCNRNAALVCDALGIELAPDWCGDMKAGDFQGRILLALAISPTDEGMPSYEHNTEPGTARVIEGSRPAGYLQERLSQLRSLADWAVEHDTEVWWA
jgi:hypothetical protein